MVELSGIEPEIFRMLTERLPNQAVAPQVFARAEIKINDHRAMVDTAQFSLSINTVPYGGGCR